MPLKFPVKSGGDFKRCTPGNHFAVCDIVADLGIQPGHFGDKHQVYIRFEIPAERVSFERDGKKQEGPQVIGMTLTASMHKKASLRKQLESWRGKSFTDDEASDFDIAAILGKPCMLNVVENPKDDGTMSSYIMAVGPLPKGTQIPKAELPLLFYSKESPDQFDKLSEYMQKKIMEQLQPVVKPKLNPTAPEDDYGDISGSFTATDSDLPDFEDDTFIPF